MTKLDEYIHTWRKEDFELPHTYEDDDENVIQIPFSDTTHVFAQLCLWIDPLNIQIDKEVSYEYQKENANILETVEKAVRNQVKKRFVEMALEEITPSEMSNHTIFGIPLKVCYSLPDNTIIASPDVFQEFARRLQMGVRCDD